MSSRERAEKKLKWVWQGKKTIELFRTFPAFSRLTTKIMILQPSWLNETFAVWKDLEFYILRVSKYPIVLGIVSSFTYFAHTVYTYSHYTVFTDRCAYVKSCNRGFWGTLWFGLMCFTVKWETKGPGTKFLKMESINVVLWKGLMVAAKKIHTSYTSRIQIFQSHELGCNFV